MCRDSSGALKPETKSPGHRRKGCKIPDPCQEHTLVEFAVHAHQQESNQTLANLVQDVCRQCRGKLTLGLIEVPVHCHYCHYHLPRDEAKVNYISKSSPIISYPQPFAVHLCHCRGSRVGKVCQAQLQECKRCGLLRRRVHCLVVSSTAGWESSLGCSLENPSALAVLSGSGILQTWTWVWKKKR